MSERRELNERSVKFAYETHVFIVIIAMWIFVGAMETNPLLPGSLGISDCCDLSRVPFDDNDNVPAEVSN